MVARCSHTSTNTGFGYLGRNLAQVGHLRFRAYRNSNLASCCKSLGSIHRWSRSCGHHLWLARLLGSNRHEAPDRVFVCCTHGFRNARHLNTDQFWYDGRDVWNGCSRSDHWHVVLYCRQHQRALSHPRDQATWWCTQAVATPRLDLWFVLYGIAWLARPCRLLGRVSSHLVGIQPCCWPQ